MPEAQPYWLSDVHARYSFQWQLVIHSSLYFSPKAALAHQYLVVGKRCDWTVECGEDSLIYDGAAEAL